MKKIVTLFALSIYCITLSAQKLELAEVEAKLSKEAAKAQKSGLLLPAGYYWNQDKSSIHQFYVFTPKKSNESYLEVITASEDGKVGSVETLPNQEKSLAKFNLRTLEAVTEESQKELKGLSVAFLRNPKLAGMPTLITGSFVDRYKETLAGSLWVGYKFEKTDEQELSNKFWNFVSFPLGNDVIAKNSYLLGDPGSLRGALQGFGIREYLPLEGKAYVGGLKAVSGSNIFISGILNVKDGTWESVEDIDLGMKLTPGYDNPFYRHENGNTSILLNSGEEYKLLHVDAKGSKISLEKLQNPKSGGKYGGVPSRDLTLVGNKLFALTATFENISGKGIGLSISQLEDGKPTEYWTYTNEDLVSTIVLAPKQKLKVEKMKFFNLQSMKQLNNGDYLVNGFSNYDRANSSDRVFLALQISADGALKATYVLDSIEKNKDQLFNYSYGNIAPTIKETNNGFFWIERAVLKGEQKGIHTSTHTGYSTITNKAWRIDDTIARGQVAKVNTIDMTLSEVVQVGKIVGDAIGDLSQSGHLALFAGSGLIILK